jgi:hypothetical protein
MRDKVQVVKKANWMAKEVSHWTLLVYHISFSGVPRVSCNMNYRYPIHWP